MITNLFNIFDPSSSTNIRINWLSIVICLVLLPSTAWVIKNYTTKSFFILYNYIFTEFIPLIKKNPQRLIISIRLFIFILLNNLPGLLPYIFTATRHIRVALSLALPLWLGLIIHGWYYNTRNNLIHLIPNGTPFILIPFIVLIETVRNLIRPITLSVRLAANIIAGHLLITLLTSTNNVCAAYVTPILFISQTLLAGLEIAVAFIQAYVFRVLITLYSSERIS